MTDRLYPGDTLSPEVKTDADFKRVYALPTRATIRAGSQCYRATYARGAKGVSAPIHADFQVLIYASGELDAERIAEKYARDTVNYLIACRPVE